MTTIEQLKESMPSGEHPKKKFQDVDKATKQKLKEAINVMDNKDVPDQEKPVKKGKKK